MSQEPRIHQRSPWSRAFFTLPLGAILLGVVINWIFYPPRDHALSGFVTCVLVLFLAWDRWLSGRSRLIVSPEGITLRHEGRHLHTTWSNIEDLDVVHSHEGFRLRAPINPTVRKGSPHFRPVYQNPTEEILFIPIADFAWALRRGTLLRDIQWFAPALGHVAEANLAEEWSPENVRRRWIQAACITGLIAGIAAVLLSINYFFPRLIENAATVGELVSFGILIAMAVFGLVQVFRKRLWGYLLLIAVVLVLAYLIWKAGQ